MSWAIGALVRARGVLCVPIEETALSVGAHGGRIAGQGSKRPLLLLIIRDDEVTGIGLDGKVSDGEAIERRFPGAIDRAISRARSARA